MGIPKVSIIILNWNRFEDTKECLESCQKINYENFEIIVVDNGSTDNSADKIACLFPKVTLLRSSENLGYAGGNNIALRHILAGDAEYCLLLNNDTTVDPGLLGAFLDSAGRHPEAGIFSAKIYFYSQPEVIWFAGGIWDRKGRRFFHRGQNRVDSPGLYDLEDTLDFASGCALFIRRAVIEKIGLIDPRFFLFFEETDWCYRATKAGFRILFVPEAKVWHKVSVSFGGKASPLYSYYQYRNWLLWVQKNLCLRERWPAYFAALSSAFLPNFTYGNGYPVMKRFYWDFLLFFRRSNALLLRAKIRGVLDFIFRRFGKCPPGIEKLNELWIAK